ncbi:beta-lactamase family protein [Pyxidicoccus parkwayensis]|uniref:Beta-lactamase family protein n=1 Tax=Pyxidicoccus parkwayensis TaxID=2813578 RepID=A0ABX7P497_9BACT|nr:serine hydrolase domain-containing protein [Pyxidicoccus parkwaysis]QSQ25309.1 beta-lactamase family protein [Pyxidicoccus parkwaysis]
MNALRTWILCGLLASGCATAPAPREESPAPSTAALDAEAARAMAATGAKGLAIAVIDDGRVVATRAYGARNAKGEPLQTDTVMYGASITKTLFAYVVGQLADEKRIDLDASIARYLDKPLPDYPDEDRYSTWSNLAGDERWRAITPRILLTHSSGFANFGFLEPDGRLRIHFAPGSRYAYSGDGLILMQFVLERGLGLDVGAEMQKRVFDRFGMRNTSMVWRPDFARNLADGWKAEGGVEPHDERSRVRAAGSMDTTLDDLSRFAAALVRGEGLSPQAFAEMTRPQLAITTPSQFPTLQDELPPEQRRKDLAAGLGVVVFDGPQGRGFFKTGHNDSTGNVLVCLPRGRRCVLILSNDVRAEAAFPQLVRFVLGEAGVPWDWEYGSDMTFWDGR